MEDRGKWGRGSIRTRQKNGEGGCGSSSAQISRAGCAHANGGSRSSLCTPYKRAFSLDMLSTSRPSLNGIGNEGGIDAKNE